MKRRILLRGLGGACVAAPFLGSLFGHRSNAAPPAPPRRLVVMFTHYGCVTNRFFPQKSHGALTAEDLAPTSLKHLTPFIDKLLIPRGIRAMNEWTSRADRGQGNDPHTQVVGSFFTCHPVTPHSDDPFSFQQETKFYAMPVAPSLDHVIAKQLSPGGLPFFLRVGGRTDIPQSAISYSAPETLYSGFASLTEAFSSLTGLFQDGPTSPDTYAMIQGKSVIDLVAEDLATLERHEMSASDRQKLEAWKALLDDTGRAVGSAECNTPSAERLSATQAFVDGVASTDDILTTKVNGSELDGADIHSNIAVLAAVCAANPVIFLKYPASYVFTGLGLTTESHSLSHRIGSPTGGCLPNVIDMLSSIDDYYCRKFAHLVSQLNQIDEGDGKVLDNTAAVWFQEMSDGNAHNLNNLPIVQVGGAGGYFKTGWTVNVEGGAADLSNGNSEAFCSPSGAPNDPTTPESTGTDPAFANAPINKYYCNLMNALGVRAGEDGFPLSGGTAEVTRFGMYDKTEDFVGGGVNPPMIHAPGEYTELKASS